MAEKLCLEITSTISSREKYISRLRKNINSLDTAKDSIEDIEAFWIATTDLLLLIRSVSIDVIEGIAQWRRLFNRGKPLPFVYKGRDHYLRQICQDTSFLYQSRDFCNYMGDLNFNRNPFFIENNLDDLICSILGMGNTAKKLREKPKSKARKSRLNSYSNCHPEHRGEGNACPGYLLANDMSPAELRRILNAANSLIFEEGLYGRLESASYKPEAIDEVLSPTFKDGKLSSVLGCTRKLTIYEELQEGNNEYRTIKRKYNEVQNCLHAKLYQLQEIDLEVSLIRYREKCEEDDTHRKYSMICRRSAKERCEAMRRHITNEVDTAKDVSQSIQNILTVTKKRLERLHREKIMVQQDYKKRRGNAIEISEANQRTATQLQKQKYEIARHRAKAQAKRVLRQKKTRQKLNQHKKERKEAVQSAVYREIKEIEVNDSEYIKAKRVQEDEIRRKRDENLRARADAKALKHIMQKETNSRRFECAMMLSEDKRSMKMRSKLLSFKEKQLNRTKKCIQSTKPIFSTSSHVGSCIHRIAVYQQFAGGYLCDGFNFKCTNPNNSQVFNYYISENEYRNLGYSSSPGGFQKFCLKLCLVYNKRKREFELVWSGAACTASFRHCHEGGDLRRVLRKGTKVAGALVLLQMAVQLKNDRILLLCIKVDGSDVQEIEVNASNFVLQNLYVSTINSNGQPDLRWMALECEEQPNIYSHVHHEMRIADSNEQLMSINIYESRNFYKIVAKSTDSDCLYEKQFLRQAINPFNLDFTELDIYPRLTRLLDFSLKEDTVSLKKGFWRKEIGRHIYRLKLSEFGAKMCNNFWAIKLHAIQYKTGIWAGLLISAISVKQSGIQEIFVSLNEISRNILDELKNKPR